MTCVATVCSLAHSASHNGQYVSAQRALASPRAPLKKWRLCVTKRRTLLDGVGVVLSGSSKRSISPSRSANVRTVRASTRNASSFNALISPCGCGCTRQCCPTMRSSNLERSARCFAGVNRRRCARGSAGVDSTTVNTRFGARVGSFFRSFSLDIALFVVVTSGRVPECRRCTPRPAGTAAMCDSEDWKV